MAVGSFAKQAAEVAQATATLHGADEGSGDIAISSWVDIVEDIMQSEYSYGDLKGYME